MQQRYDTISLIGMPGVGKSTVGVILAKLIGLDFCDADVAIQVREHCTLQEIMDLRGYSEFCRIEEEVLLALPLAGRVVATGGSVVYSDAIMARLADAGPLVYLEADVGTLLKRVAANPDRGIANSGGKTFEDIYDERIPLYRRYADHTVDAVTGDADRVAAAIAASLGITAYETRDRNVT